MKGNVSLRLIEAFLFILLIVLIYLVFFEGDQVAYVVNFIGITSVMMQFLSYIFKHEEVLVKLKYRIKSYLQNIETKWNISIEYNLFFNMKQIDSLVIKLNKHYNDRCRVIQKNEHESIIQVDSFQLRIINVGLYNENAQDLGIYSRIVIENYKIQYRKIKKIISNDFMNLLKIIENTGGIKNEDQCYYFKILFDEENPFFGLYIDKLKKEDVLDYRAEIANDKSSSVQISKKQIDITANEKIELIKLVDYYISISGTK